MNDTLTAPLRTADRCDQCNAQAMVRLRLAGSVLDFCAHHYGDHSAKLTLAGFTVTDDARHTL